MQLCVVPAAIGLLICDEFVDVAVRSPEVLPGRAGFPQQFHAGAAEFFDRYGQIAYRKADHWSCAEVFLAWILGAEDLDMAAIGKLENPEARFGVNQSLTKCVFVEVREFRGAFRARPAPAKACDLHADQYCRRTLAWPD